MTNSCKKKKTVATETNAKYQLFYDKTLVKGDYCERGHVVDISEKFEGWDFSSSNQTLINFFKCHLKVRVRDILLFRKLTEIRMETVSIAWLENLPLFFF